MSDVRAAPPPVAPRPGRVPASPRGGRSARASSRRGPARPLGLVVASSFASRGGAAPGTAPRRRRRRAPLAPPRAALPETSDIAADGVEGYVRVLELAYGDESLGNEVRDRMGEDRQFSIGIRQAMTDPAHTERLRAAIDASPYMKAAAEEATRRRTGSDAVQQVMDDGNVRGMIQAMSDDPEALANAQEKSEELLKKVCVDLVEGVREYREDFEPDADDLIAKFQDIAERGYEAFVKISMEDVKVKNAVINALMDEMEEAQEKAARGQGGGAEGGEAE